MNARVLALASVALLAGCAGQSGISYVGPLGAPADAALLVASMADFVAGQLPAANTTLVLDPLPEEQSGNSVTPAFEAQLRQRGFATVDTAHATQGAHRVRYWVTPLSTGHLVRMAIDGDVVDGSRSFVRNAAGVLQIGGPFTVRSAGASS